MAAKRIKETDQLKSWFPSGPAQLAEEMRRHLVSTLGRDYTKADKYSLYRALAYVLRERLAANWITTQRQYYDRDAKRIYYLSLEFLIGRSLMANIQSLGLEDEVRRALALLDIELEELELLEPDAGLGNGGLGRLAACYMDSMATLGVPGYGYGIRYEYGIFNQAIERGAQVEYPDNWMHYGNPWEYARLGFTYLIHLYGRVEEYTDDKGRMRHRWTDTARVRAMPCDMMVPGYLNGNVTNMRLWAARASQRFNLDLFNSGDYIRSMEDTVMTETISKVLYPNDQVSQGRELRLVQQYFFVSATMQDILRRFMKLDLPLSRLPDKVAVQLNETHASVAIPELMRILLDEHGLGWEEAWDITVGTFAYTNHTVMPEALEKWPLDMFGRVLPRHMGIIYEINRRFLDRVRSAYPEDGDRVARMSLIEERPVRQVRMAWLAALGSRATNGVSALHTDLIKKTIFKDFSEMFPDRFVNVTNGVTPRRWLKQCNPSLSGLITEHLGPGWVTDLDKLSRLKKLAEKEDFLARWREAKAVNKRRLAGQVMLAQSMLVPETWMFDVQVKRIHEYKRQLLNVLHTLDMYLRIKDGNTRGMVPRLKVFGGKAAPGYRLAKLIIRLINAVASVVNADKDAEGLLKVAFLPNYRVSLAEIIIPAADLSEQISLAGTEASGTGNMKFALNGALTMGTLDGANVEILEAVGEENIFIFGLTEGDVALAKARGYDPKAVAKADPRLDRILAMIRDGAFSNGDTELFKPILDALLAAGDVWMVLADFADFVEAQDKADAAFADKQGWDVKSLMNTANMGRFSSDRSIKDYVEKVWNKGGARP